jgi:hypothetical protein
MAWHGHTSGSAAARAGGGVRAAVVDGQRCEVAARAQHGCAARGGLLCRSWYDALRCEARALGRPGPVLWPTVPRMGQAAYRPGWSGRICSIGLVQPPLSGAPSMMRAPTDVPVLKYVTACSACWLVGLARGVCWRRSTLGGLHPGKRATHPFGLAECEVREHSSLRAQACGRRE